MLLFPLLALTVSFAAAPVGIVSLWVALLMPGATLARYPRVRVALVIAIGVGIVERCIGCGSLSGSDPTARR
jgi:hypothetical protein